MDVPVGWNYCDTSEVHGWKSELYRNSHFSSFLEAFFFNCLFCVSWAWLARNWQAFHMSTFSKLAFFPLSSEMTIKVVQCYQVWFLHISQKSFSPRIFVNSFVNSLSIHLSIHLSIRLSICLGPSIKAVFSLFKTWLLLDRRFCKNLWPSQNIWTLLCHIRQNHATCFSTC